MLSQVKVQAHRPSTQPEQAITTQIPAHVPNRTTSSAPVSQHNKSYLHPDKITPESLQQAWQHQREAEANTREVMQKLSVTNFTTEPTQSWWKRMKERVYTFTKKKENLEFYGMTALQFTPLQLLCAYLTPLHVHCEGWSDQLTIVAMMYHMQTLDLLPSVTSIGIGSSSQESFCTHVKDLPIASTLSSATKSLFTNRQSKCTTRRTQLHDYYGSTVASSLLETKRRAQPRTSSGGRGRHKRSRRSRFPRRSRHSRKK
jgi:hypothetical protein